MHDETDAAAAPERSEPPWLQVARATFHHHVRGPWFVLLCLVGLLSPVLGILWLVFDLGRGGSAWGLLPLTTTLVEGALPIVLLLLVVPGFRGAWLRDPSAARERVSGYFAGTWAAVVAALVPWALVALAAGTWADGLWSALLATLLHFVGLALLGAAWVALWLLVAAAFRREETRWVAAGALLVTLTMVLPTLGSQAVLLWQRAEGAMPNEVPAWALAFRVLSPNGLQDLLASTMGTSTYDPFGDQMRAALVGLYNPVVVLLLLALWAALPLGLAVRAQERARDPVAPLEMDL